MFVNFFTYGQEKNIYILYNKSDLLTSYNEELIASKDSALFWNEVQVKTDGSNQMTDDGNGNFNLIDENYHIFKNEISLNKSNTINIRIFDPNNFRDVTDILPDFNWKIFDNETKKIGQYECIKATCNFRGTNIIAYFTLEIPIPFGPWKFKDLPGLILEINVEDAFLNIKWVAEKIIYPYEKKQNLESNIPTVRISMREEVKNLEKTLNEISEQSKSRDSETITTIVSEITRIDIEKIYEWEE